MLAKLVQSPLVVGLVISILVFVGLLGLRLAGSFETSELAVYDWYLRRRPDVPADARIVLITVTENDIRQQGTWPLPDATIARALDMLAASQPRAIGLDIYRDIPVPPGHDALETVWRINLHLRVEASRPTAVEDLSRAQTGKLKWTRLPFMAISRQASSASSGT